MNHFASIGVATFVIVLALLALVRRLRKGAPCACGGNCSSCHLCHQPDEQARASESCQSK